jgi:hypothetical protein
MRSVEILWPSAKSNAMMATSETLMAVQIFANLSQVGLGIKPDSLRDAGTVSGSEPGRSVMMGMSKGVMDAATSAWLKGDGSVKGEAETLVIGARCFHGLQ